MNIMKRAFLFFWFLSATLTYADPIRIVTEEFPPYNFIKNGKVTGFATDILKKALENLHINAPIKMLPWARAYRVALHDPDILIYSIVRTREREHLFKWVEKIAPSNVYLFKLKDRHDITATSLQEIKDKYKIGVYRDDVITQYLISKGFKIGKQLDVAIDDSQNISKLMLGRVDFIVIEEISLLYRLKMLKKEKKYLQLFGRKKVEKHMFLGYMGDLYFAFSKKTPDRIVYKFRKALRKVKKGACYKKIYNNYFE